jgi:hypothetical protein
VRLPCVRFTVRRMMIAVAVVAFMIPIGVFHETAYLSCHVCHNRAALESKSFFVLQFAHHDAMKTHFPTEPGHRHQWTRYSLRTQNLISGIGRGCRANIYADGSAAPDRTR